MPHVGFLGVAAACASFIFQLFILSRLVSALPSPIPPSHHPESPSPNRMQRAALLTVDSCIRGVGRGAGRREGGVDRSTLSFVSNLSIYLCCVSVAVSVSAAHCIMKIFIFPSSSARRSEGNSSSLPSLLPLSVLCNPLPKAVRSAKCVCVVVCVSVSVCVVHNACQINEI